MLPLRRLVRSGVLMAAAWAVVVPAAVAAAQGRDEGRVRADAIDLTLAGRVQMQFNTSSVDDVPETEMILRRVRFGANVRLNETVSGRIHPELSGSTLSLTDAFVQLNFAPALQFIAGKAHRPFGIIEQTSSNQILPIERGVRIRGLQAQELSTLLNDLRYTDRDVGVMIRGAPENAPLGLSWVAGIFAGPLQGNAGDQDTRQFVARVGMAPVEGVRIGAAWSRRDFRLGPASDPLEIEAGDAFVADLEYGGFAARPGLHFVLEAATGDYDPFDDVNFSGIQGWLSYRARVGDRVTLVEPLIRVSHAEVEEVPGSPAIDGTLITPGLNLYLGGLNRLLLNYDIWLGEGDLDESSFKAQLQMAF